MMDYLYGVDMIPPEEVKSGGVTSEMARRWMLLQSLQVCLLTLSMWGTSCPLQHAGSMRNTLPWLLDSISTVGNQHTTTDHLNFHTYGDGSCGLDGQQLHTY